jgi:ADP-heptose:LPS heptosyltransferase
MERILVIQLRQLGDTLFSTPLVRQLRRLHPAAEIDWLCQGFNACILRHHPDIRRLETLPRSAKPMTFARLAARLRARRYDFVVDPQTLSKTAILSWLSGAPKRIGFRRPWKRAFYTKTLVCSGPEYSATRRLRLLDDPRVDLQDTRFDFFVGADDLAAAQTFCKAHFDRPVAAIYGCRSEFTRHWPPENYAAIGDRLAKSGFLPWLVYGPGEHDAARHIASLMRHPALVEYPLVSFPVLKEILSRCAVMVTCDGGPKTVAVAAGTPTVTLYHGAQAVAWNVPGEPRHRVVTSIFDGPLATAMREKGSEVSIGTVTDAPTTSEIPVDAIWNEVEMLLDHLKRNADLPASAIGASSTAAAIKSAA